MNRNYKSAIEKRRFPDDFSSDVIHDIQIVNFGDFEDIKPFGSFALRLPYPGDIDLVEDFKACCTVEDVINKFAIRIKKTLDEILHTNDVFMTEFKMGLDERYNLDIGTLSEGIYKVNPKLKSDIHNLRKKKLINSEQEKYMIDTLDNPHYSHQGHLSSIPYDLVREELRHYCILRWSEHDIKQGYIKLPLGKKMTIKQALHYKTDVKIDIIEFSSNTFTEVTNYILLIVMKDGKPHYIVNRDHNYSDQYIIQDLEDGLKQEIEKLFYSKIYFNPFKGAKRLFALARHFNDNYILEKIFPLLDSGIAQLYQIKSELDSIRLINDRANFSHSSFKDLLPKIISRLQQLKTIIPNILEISHELDDAIKLFDFPRNKIIGKKEFSDQLTQLIEKILKAIDKYTMQFLSDQKVYPIMRNYLPIHLSYIPENTHAIIDYPRLKLDEIVEEELSDITTETESESEEKQPEPPKPMPNEEPEQPKPIEEDKQPKPKPIEDEDSESLGIDWEHLPNLFGDDPSLLDTLQGIKPKKKKKGWLDWLDEKLESDSDEYFSEDNKGINDEEMNDEIIIEENNENNKSESVYKKWLNYWKQEY